MPKNSAAACVWTFRARLLDVGFGAYRGYISPFLHAAAGPSHGCRYHPSCSEYAYEAIKRHGFLFGVRLALARLARCHPFSQCPPDDPVP